MPMNQVFKNVDPLLAFKNNRRLFFLAFATTVFVVPVTVLEHEGGHILAAKILGYETRLHYARMDAFGTPVADQWNKFMLEHAKEIVDGVPFENDQRFEELDRQFFWDNYLITLGGPITSVLTGMVGFFILIYRQKRNSCWSVSNWIGLFLSIFLTRYLYMFFHRLPQYWLTGDKVTYYTRDEVWLAYRMGLPTWMFFISAGLIAFAICWYIFFRIIGKDIRPPIFWGSLIGTGTSYILWIHWIGPIILP